MVGNNNPGAVDVAGPSAVPTVSIIRPMSIEEFQQEQALVQAIVAEMKNGVHYGLIPGTKDRSLWEAGAEYLRRAFRVEWDYDVEEKVEDFSTHNYRYRVHAYRLYAPGVRGTGWTATAWSRERKFWCNSQECPKGVHPEHQARGMDPHDMPHNVLDRAIKRAFVALIRNVTGTTGYFKEGSEEDSPGPGRAAALEPRAAQGLCPKHHVPFVHKVGKSARTGRPFNFWSCPEKDGSVYCKERPLDPTGQQAPPETEAQPTRPTSLTPPVDDPWDEQGEGARPSSAPESAPAPSTPATAPATSLDELWRQVYEACATTEGLAERLAEWYRRTYKAERMSPLYFSNNAIRPLTIDDKTMRAIHGAAGLIPK